MKEESEKNNFENDINRLFENDDFFRPLSKGLGLDHVKKKHFSTDVQVSSTQLLEEMEEQNVKKHASEDSEVDQKVLRSFRRPSLALRMSSNLLDICLVSFLYLVCLLFSATLTGASQEFLQEVLSRQGILIHILTGFLFFSILYFTFFDASYLSTPGKMYFKLRVVNQGTKDRPPIYLSFWRTLFYVVSIFLCWSPQLFKVDEWATRTQVIMRD